MVVSVFIVSDIKLYCDGLERLLVNQSDVRVIGTALSCHEAMVALTIAMPDIALIDLAMCQSLGTIRQIVDAAPSMKVVALTATESETEIVACAEAGIAGYVTRNSSVEDLVRCLRSVVVDELQCSPRVAAYLLRRVGVRAKDATEMAPFTPLTKRESHILDLIGQGLSNKEIARLLNIEVSTVKTHVHNILEKFQVHRREEVVVMARRQAGGNHTRFVGSEA